MPLGKIDLHHIARYEAARLAGAEPFIHYRRPQDARPRRLRDGKVLPAKGKTSSPASAKKANQEISRLKRILRIAGVWTEQMSQSYRPMPEEESDIPRALSPEEQAHWLKTAAGSERWHVVYFYSKLAFATCMSTNEIRALRLGDIFLDAGIITIPWSGSKNRHRHRTIGIGGRGDDAWDAIRWLLWRAGELGSKSQEHYLFPFHRPPADFIPERPMTVSGIRHLWREVQQASRLKQFRPYDTRHTAITRLAENGIEMSTIMKLAGHISPKMTEH